MRFPEKKIFTEAEYLQLERNSTEKHEYFQGEIFAMSGASRAHIEIFSNLFGELATQLKGKKCRPYGSDFRVSIPKNTLYTYPDISVICNEPDLTDLERDTYTNPTIIFEILSKSTRNYDQGEKFSLYREIDSLKDYILIDSQNFKVQIFSKNDDETWLLSEFKNEKDVLFIPTLNISINFTDIYYNVKFL